MLAAPLLAGNDLPHMTPEIKSILTNSEVVAIDQDPLGHQARHIYSSGEVEVWARDLKGGAEAIAILNVGSDIYSTHPFRLSLVPLGLAGIQTAKNLWTGESVVLSEGKTFEIPSHDILLLRIDRPDRTMIKMVGVRHEQNQPH
jgi:alpha-galactosidase